MKQLNEIDRKTELIVRYIKKRKRLQRRYEITVA